MTDVLDGCDGEHSTYNSNNYQFGATLTTADGWEYKLTPLSQQVNEVSCDASYKLALTFIEIPGKDWLSEELGEDGNGLKRELTGCGTLTEYYFEITPDDYCFQWYASGRIEIGTKSFIGRAVKAAGGADGGNCKGAGRKRREMRAGIGGWSG